MWYPSLFCWSIWFIRFIFFYMHADSGWNHVWQYVHFSPFLPFPPLDLEASVKDFEYPSFLGFAWALILYLSLDLWYWCFPYFTVSACAFGPLIFPMLMSLVCSCVVDSIILKRRHIPGGSRGEFDIMEFLSEHRELRTKFGENGENHLFLLLRFINLASIELQKQILIFGK